MDLCLKSLLTRPVTKLTDNREITNIFIDRFADDKVTWEIDRQFLWGPSLLISPVLEEVKTGEEGGFLVMRCKEKCRFVSFDMRLR